jgi:hypothetical protein
MTVDEHLSTFHGLPIVTFETDEPPAGPFAWRIAVESYDPEEPFEVVLARFFATVDTSSVTALVIGSWGEPADGPDASMVVGQLVEAKDRLPALTGIFLGDIIFEEQEISWIKQGDVTRLLTEFPRLTELAVRGGDGLALRPVKHAALRTLRFEAGGLPVSVIRAIAESDLPALVELRLWLGVAEYGADWQLSDLEPLLDGKKFPALRCLGLQNSELQNDIAKLVAESAILDQLEIVDLSMGTLTDEGAIALLAATDRLSQLKKLDLHYHYIGSDLVAQLHDALRPAGVEVALDDPQKHDIDGDNVYYHTAVSE